MMNISIDLVGLDHNMQLQRLSISQSCLDHHYFDLLLQVPVDNQVTEQTWQSVLGEPIGITWKSMTEPSNEGTFRGIVTGVRTHWAPTNLKTLRLTGASPSILLDGYPRFRTFAEITISEVLDEVMSSYADRGFPDLSQNSTGISIDWKLQYQLSDFKFLQYLAEYHQRLFFYDGTKFYFGNLRGAADKALDLHPGKNLIEAEIQLGVTPNKQSISGYQLTTGKEITQESDRVGSSDELIQLTASKSSAFTVVPQWINRALSEPAELKKLADQRQVTARGASVVISGHSRTSALRPGSRIRLVGLTEFSGENDFFITKVDHLLDRDGAYQNYFTAIPTDDQYPPPLPAEEKVATGVLTAVVKDNQDPQALARIRVQFIGDESETVSPWLPTLTAFTGNGGTFTLPENGDRVQVFFTNFHQDKLPFVMGSFYDGQLSASDWKPGERGICWGGIRIWTDGKKLWVEAPEIVFSFSEKMKIGDGSGARVDIDAKAIYLKP